MEEPALVDIAAFHQFITANPQAEQLPPELQEACQKVRDSFHYTGVLVIRDPRVNEEDNFTFIDMLEQYFQRASTQLYNGQEIPQNHPELHYQVGVTPHFIEKARNHCHRWELYNEQDKPLSECPPEADAKWRYFWRIGEMSDNPSEIDNENQVPEDFPQWPQVMNNWGNLLLNSLETVVRMLEYGVGIKSGKLVDQMKGAANLLAPTGSDLDRFGQGTVFAGIHYDLNFITIHGKSRYPALSVWLRNNKKVRVSIPDGCLLLQSAKMLENLSGGYIQAGFHEVVFTEKTQEALDRAREQGRILWRVSSTLFGHLRSECSVAPMEEFARFWESREEVQEKYPDKTAFDIVKEELQMIGLWRD